jgi:hypothetical protein
MSPEFRSGWRHTFAAGIRNWLGTKASIYIKIAFFHIVSYLGRSDAGRSLTVSSSCSSARSGQTSQGATSERSIYGRGGGDEMTPADMRTVLFFEVGASSPRVLHGEIAIRRVQNLALYVNIVSLGSPAYRLSQWTSRT